MPNSQLVQTLSNDCPQVVQKCPALAGFEPAFGSTVWVDPSARELHVTTVAMIDELHDPGKEHDPRTTVWLDRQIEELVEHFVESDEGAALLANGGGLPWPGLLIRCAADELGRRPEELSPAFVRRVVFELLPQRVVCEIDDAERIIAELRAFFRFAASENRIAEAAACAEIFDEAAVNVLRHRLADRNRKSEPPVHTRSPAPAAIFPQAQGSLDGFATRRSASRIA